MKTKIVLIAVFIIYAANSFAAGTKEKIKQQFPYAIQFELGASGFSDGDQITITSVRGDREHIEPGGGYVVEGTYTLHSADSADLCLFCTSRGPSGSTPVQETERLSIKTKGTGNFQLYETNVPDGWLHVSFYPHHSSSGGGVYFGEKGREDTIMRKQSWFRHVTDKLTDKPSEAGGGNEANRRLLAYLGEPVQPPSDMDAKYSKKGLSHAIELAARNAGVVPKRIAIDTSEFPFLIGVVCEGSDAAKLKAELKKMDGYQYQGSIGNDSNGDGSDTCNVFSIVPYQAQPDSLQERIHHRLMLRYQVFYDRIAAEE